MPARRGLAADPASAAAVVGLRQRSTPYHLAHGRLDDAEYLGTWTMTRHPGPRSAEPVTLPAACAASRRRIALLTSSPQNSGSGARW
jgi:alkanesulfonate monooxygenase SsuD/methylene tetrahydromethanopterin reductase-like flavin-dependent oxidoreductase (luciferase family)